MSEERTYIYSIIRNPQETRNSDTLRLSEAIFGLNNREVVLVPRRGIAAAVSNTPVMHFDQFDKKELTRFVAIHERVNADLVKRHDVLPMRFGMIAENSEEIRTLLTKAYVQFQAALERITGKAEFIVQVFWNEKNILGKIVRENTDIQTLKKEAESKGKILGFSAKMKLGKRVFEALESRRKEYTADILGYLAASFPDGSAGKLLDTDTEGGEKEMLMNYSFLVGRTEESALESQLNTLAEKYHQELKFKYIGPMAPYSFAVLNLSAGNFEVVDTARKALGLGESATLREIRDAYHALAAEHHPDKHAYEKGRGRGEGAEKRMKDIIAANRVLGVYCRQYLSARAPQQEQWCSFKKEDVENSIMLKEK